MLRDVDIGARDEDAELGVLRERRPRLLTVDDVDVAVALGADAQVREVGTRARLTEELTPELLAGEHRPEVAVLLLLARQRDERRAAVADADRVHRLRHAGPLHLALDDELRLGIGVEAPRPRPVRDDEPGVDELARRRLRVLLEPGPHLEPPRIVFGRQIEVHRSPIQTGSAGSVETDRRMASRGYERPPKESVKMTRTEPTRSEPIPSDQDPGAHLAAMRVEIPRWGIEVGPVGHIAKERERVAALRWHHFDARPLGATVGAVIEGVDLAVDLADQVICEPAKPSSTTR